MTTTTPTRPRRRYVQGDEDLAARAAVVCAVADDECAVDVVETASELAARLGLRLVVVHSPAPDVFLVGEEQRAALDRGHALLDRLASRWRTAERVVQTGDPATLVNAVAADDAAFIVVGSRGRGALASALLGSVSAEIARDAPASVVIVRGPAAPADTSAASG
jgi:nucleotide-binding universal stress UspA family protein